MGCPSPHENGRDCASVKLPSLRAKRGSPEPGFAVMDGRAALAMTHPTPLLFQFSIMLSLRR